jgi:uncharacterized protein YyaL (SSP411 family)
MVFRAWIHVLMVMMRYDMVVMTEVSISGNELSRAASQPNRLIAEKSPYLLQHACNPVNWYPWGEEAFDAARMADKPIFLSVGYSTCHWCHVMAHESFEDPDVAGLLNQSFICIKVDREERPDIDQMYMAIAIGMTGRGGWPLTIIMTPEKKPFYAATYIPKNGRYGQAGMMELIPRIKDIWNNNRNELLSSSDRIVDRLMQLQHPKAASGDPDASILARGYQTLAAVFDAKNGGFGTAPKFPAPHNILFLLRYWRRTGDDQTLEMVETTLQAMRMGGIYDHVGFGFHRYSTDAEWSLPHFEKMLYDQALLALAYIEAYQATGKGEYAGTAREILEYVLRDMTNCEGGFYSAEDADSEGEEGKFYSWTAEELKEVLDNEEFKLLIRLFDVHERGNFEKGRNILRQTSAFSDAAEILKMPERELCDSWNRMRVKLFQTRDRRAHPLKDDKILTDWNGLMIAALAKGAQALNAPEYAKAAKKAADFLIEKMQNSEGRLLHRYRGTAGLQANLDDYAFLVWGLIDLYETVFDIRYLEEAMHLNRVMLQHFWDSDLGGLFFSPGDGEALLMRRKEYSDGALPSGNSVALQNMLRLMHLTGDQDLGKKALDLSRAAFAVAGEEPAGHTMLLCALDYALGPIHEIAFVGEAEDSGIIEMLHAIRSRFLPNKAVVLVSGREIGEAIPFAKDLVQLDGKATAYICSDHVCQLPTTNPEMMTDLLGKNG